MKRSRGSKISISIQKGLLQDTKEGALLVDLSPTTPSFARELYAVARVNERNTLDAPLVVRNIVEKMPSLAAITL